MKKIITLLLCAMLFSAAYASETTIKFGARALGGLDLTDQLVPKSHGINLYANIPLPFVDGLGVQPEITIARRYIKTTLTPIWFYPFWKVSGTADYTVLELPAMATYTFKINDSLAITPEAGLQLDYIIDSGDYSPDHNLHLVFATGARGEYALGPGDIVGGVRYFVSITTEEGHHIQGVDFHVGYQLKMNIFVSHSSSSGRSSKSRGKAI